MVSRVLGCAALGLPAALLAHTMVFGSAHAPGAGWHGLLINLCAVLLALPVASIAYKAALGTEVAVQGSVLAARIDRLIPSFIALALSASAWIMVIELFIEHAAHFPFAAWILAVLAAAAIAKFAMRFALRAVARIAIALRHSHATISQPERAPVTLRFAPRVQSVARRFRLFSRPPPALT